MFGAAASADEAWGFVEDGVEVGAVGGLVGGVGVAAEGSAGEEAGRGEGGAGEGAQGAEEVRGGGHGGGVVEMRWEAGGAVASARRGGSFFRW